MNLASAADVEVRLGRSLTSEEIPKVESLLTEASVLVEGYLDECFDALVTGISMTVPVRVRVVVSRIVARCLNAPTDSVGLESTQMSAGPYQQTRNYSEGLTSGGPWLTKADKMMLGRRSMVSQQLGSERSA